MKVTAFQQNGEFWIELGLAIWLIMQTLEFPQNAIKTRMIFPKVPICLIFEKFRVAVSRLEAPE